ncbi:MAG: lysozyme inhibitor LprI family protein, partial [Microcoleaceae cyanobacterium]
AWITMRDKSCSFESTPFAGGSIEGLVYTKCLTRMTETRTKELTNYVNTWGKEPGEPNNPKPTPTVSPSPNTSPTSSTTIESLPDGNYRFATAKLSQSIITDQDLVKAGGYYFLFRKQGRNIVGTLAQVDSENTICVSGKINGNTVTGRAVELVELPERDPSVKSIDDKFVFWDLGGDILAVRRGEKKNGRVTYNGALLNLGGLFRYNVGTRPPISQCPF